MDTVVIPIVKNKRVQLTDKDNYRPIAITTVASKMLELLILENCNNELRTADNQFGFKTSHATDMYLSTFKEIVNFYRTQGSPVYICFIDSSKAFHRVNHWSLFRKLIKRGLHFIVIRLIVYWYSSQLFCVRWGKSLSPGFMVSNRVWQGRILSPTLFNVYMDELIIALNGSKIGCNIIYKSFVIC